MILCLCPNPSVDTYAWIDTIIPGEANRITSLEEFPGGKGTHVAFALKELKAAVGLMGCWAGSAGQWLQQSCHKKNIQTKGIELEGSNRKCYTFRSEKKNFANTELLEPGPAFTNESMEIFIKEFRINSKHCDLICASGSWPANAPEDAYLQIQQAAAKANKKVIFDCSKHQLKFLLNNGSFFGLHINESEARDIFGEMDTLEILAAPELKHIELIALTKGKDGLWLKYGNEVIHANVVIEEVKSTVGSGDCLTAGIAYAVSKNLSIEEIAIYGVACGAANCMNEDLGMLHLEDVKTLIPQVKTKQLNYV